MGFQAVHLLNEVYAGSKRFCYCFRAYSIGVQQNKSSTIIHTALQYSIVAFFD
ncbi:hypothetical protein SAMN05192568_1004278 [Methylobacterium pseudosasicola]|uniref:Uncharacterized protein n=1 Tax=Methylobacterium pseudosasicola TaxID=582667 RepID=A0A1I4HJ33_9HYPH|nr:hypothetical protein SAMN05192568_1004278 [Methylobacterium pseudosasicola]